MTILIDNDYTTTLKEILANNELDSDTIKDLKELNINDTYFIGCSELKRTK